MKQQLGRLLEDEAGQDLPEYAMLIGLVALAVITAVAFLGDSISGTFNDIGSTITSTEVVDGG